MTWFGLAFGLFVIGSFGLIKPVSNLQRVYDKKLRILSIYAELISLIENREMNAPLLRHLKAEFGMNGKSTTHNLERAFTGTGQTGLAQQPTAICLAGRFHVLATPAGNAH